MQWQLTTPQGVMLESLNLSGCSMERGLQCNLLDGVRPKELQSHSCARCLSHFCCLQHKFVRQAVALRLLLATLLRLSMQRRLYAQARRSQCRTGSPYSVLCYRRPLLPASTLHAYWCS